MTTILYALASMWALGTLAACLYVCFDMADSVLGRVAALCVLLPMWVVLGLVPFAVIQHEHGPELATLLRSEWHCASSHQETTTTFVMAGKVTVPATTTSEVCDVYARN